jgi:hypothetical protein
MSAAAGGTDKFTMPRGRWPNGLFSASEVDLAQWMY